MGATANRIDARSNDRATAAWLIVAAAAVRAAFGILMAIDAWLKWQPAFAAHYVDYLQNASNAQPHWFLKMNCPNRHSEHRRSIAQLNAQFAAMPDTSCSPNMWRKTWNITDWQPLLHDLGTCEAKQDSLQVFVANHCLRDNPNQSETPTECSEDWTSA